MKNTKQILEKNPSNLVYCWKLIRKDNKIFCFTEATQDIILQNEKYLSKSGFRSSSIDENSDFTIDNLDIEGILDNELITSHDISLGLYDKATVEIFMIDQSNTENKVFLKRGYIGNIKIIGDNRFIAEINGFLQAAEQNITQRYSFTCRADLGDSKCKIDLKQHTYQGQITKIIDNKTFQDQNLTMLDGYFDYGIILFDTDNGIIQNNVKFFINKTFELKTPCNFQLKKDMQYFVTIGCNKTIEDCSKKFNNIVNFRGEPNIPGIQKLYDKEFS